MIVLQPLRWRPGRLAKLSVPLIAGLGYLIYARCTWRSHGYETWWALGAIQILEGPEGVWVFTEVDREVFRPGLLVEPSVIRLGSRQRAVLLTSHGAHARYDLGEVKSSLSFNLSRIFRSNGRFYCIQGSSLERPRTLWVFGDRGFTELPTPESDQILSALRLADATSANLAERVDMVSEQNGWRRICDERIPLEWRMETIRSDAHGIVFSVRGAGSVRSLIAKAEPGHGGWVETIIDADQTRRRISPAEYEAMWKRAE